MSAHTPGPWHPTNHPKLATGEVRSAGGIWVARVHQRDGEGSMDPECVANTHLIAAAPDMLADAKDLLDLLDDADLDEEGMALFRRVRANIAKAEGKS